MTMAKVISYGAAQKVTGSCHLLEIKGIKVLIDCGMVQGRDWMENYDPFPFDPKSIDYLVLTHAHADHVGRLPKLVKEGFNGEIIATQATLDVAYIMLLDSAGLLYEEYETQIRKALRRGEEALVKEPLYLREHVEQVFTKKRRVASYGEALVIAPFLKLSLHNAGHIIGSAFIVVDYDEDNLTKRVVFSGDLGSKNRLLLGALEVVKRADTLFIESTYGDREHRAIKESIAEFREAIIKTIHEGGNVLIPSFALERTQEILWLLHSMHEEGLLQNCKVFLDSPLAIEATKIYQKYPTELNREVGLHVSLGDDPFDFPQLKYTPRKIDSMQINEIEKRAIIIAGSGMCTGGRILHHLKARIWNPKNCVIFVGFQVKGTLGREIVDGAEFVRIYGEDIKVRSSIRTINGFSAHADRADMLSWMKQMEGLQTIYLIHGEPEKMEDFKMYIKENLGTKTHIVKKEETIYI